MSKTKWYRVQILDATKSAKHVGRETCAICYKNIEDGDYCYDYVGNGINNVVHEECAIRLTKDVLRQGIDV